MLLSLALTVGAPAGAQDPSEDALERLRRFVPEGRPAAYDIAEADAVYRRLAALAVVATPAGELGGDSRLTGPCGGFAYSYDADGFLLDAAADLGDRSPPVDLLDGGQAFTTNNPFRLDPGGAVLYYGFSPRDGDGPVDHHWMIKTSSGTVDEGGDANVAGINRHVGVIDLADRLPFDFSARLEVDGGLSSRNLAECIGEGDVEFVGGGLLSPIGIAALVVLAAGLAGLMAHARPSTKRQA